MVKNKTILVICTGNSARSQMMEGMLNHEGKGHISAYSAGIEPSVVNPLAIQVMHEIGVDISHHRSKSIEEFRGWQFDLVITVCDSAREKCPFFPGKEIIHHGFPDPSDFEGDEQKQLEQFIKIRDQELEWVKNNIPNWLDQNQIKSKD